YQVKIRGLRIELGEIEARLMEQPEVREAVVLAVELAGSQQLVGYVVASDGSSDEGSLRETLKDRLKAGLPEYMIPVQWMFLDALPLSPNGKLERRALPRPEVGQQAEYVAPRSELEARIAGIWQEVLKVERVGMQDNFFELGGHSLLATQVISRIRQTVGLDAALKQLFEHALLDDFVRSLKPAQGAQRPALVPVKREGGIPLSYAQERQWFLWQMEPGSDAYHIPLALRLNAELRQDVLENCLQTLVQRHETLRTCFAVQGEQVMQVIAAQAHVPLTCVEVANQNELAIALQEAVQQPFDLMAGPLLRAWLVSVRGQEQVLLLNLHHIVTDAWSMRVLASELLELYAAACEGRAARLAVLPVQYADYAQWQRQWLEGGERARQLAYWTERMAGGSTVLQLPTDRARPAVQSHRGARHMFEIPQPLASQLFKLAHAARATPFMLLLASFQVLLHRYSGQTQIRVGVPIANRNVLETEGLIGFFVNTQVHQAECAAHLSFRELLSQVRMHALQGQDYQDLPFEQLVDALQPERSLSHTPLFQVMYNHRERGARELAGQPLAGLHIEELSWDTGTAQFDLTLDTYECQDGLRAALTYATDLFDAQTITRMAGHWLNLLQALSSDMDQALGDLVMLEVAEQQALLPDWQQQADTWQGELAVHQRIAQWARQTPDAPAVQCAGRQLSYAQLDAQANALATVLIERGVRPETLVGIALARSLELIVGLLAIHKAGAAYVPLDPQYPAERLAYLIEDSGMALLLTTEALEPQLPLPAQLPVLLLEACDLQRVAADPGVAVAPGNLAYVIYTSGSTGQPKGVCVEHGPLAMHCRAIGERYEMSTADCELHFMSFAFDGAHERWLTSLTHGARLLLRDEQLWSPEQTYQQMHVAGVSVAAFPPAYLQQLAEHAERDGNPPPVRVYCFGGDAVPQASYALARRALRPTWIINGYGPTETVVTPLIWKAGVEDHCQAAYAPIGSRIGERSTLVLDAGLALLPSRLPGELYLGGSGVARGYLRRPALTAERFVPDPYGPPGARLYRTGDLVSRREEGVFDYLGRVDNQVKVRGFRIELGEIEAILQRQAQVREAVVVARDLGQGAQLVAYLLADASSRDSAWQAEARLTIRAALKQTLPGYMVPSFLLFVEQWPLTPNGKLDRNALPNPDLDGLQQAYRAPQSALEQQVAQAWQQVLGVARIGLDDNFFELGGHSLLATQVTSQLQQQLSANLALDLLFKAETLADYSQAVAACVNGKLDEDMSDMHAFLAELEAN
ncbi:MULTISPECIES: non-ribosomal peptide synthetase, partial [Pseudomonas]